VVAVTPDAIWVLSPPDNSVSRIDPATNRRVATVPVGRQASGLALAAGSVWVSSSFDDTVTRIDAATNRVLARIPVGREPGAMAVAGGGTLIRLDPTSGREPARIALPRAAAQYPTRS